MTGDRTSAPQRPVVRGATLRERAVPLLGYGTSFQVRVLRRDDEAVLLILFGELDVTSMAQFERVITEVVSGSPKELIFDLSQCQFMSAQGYAAIGDCSMEVPVRVRSRTDLASKVLAIYGYDRVTVATDRGPNVDLPC
jgi:anti-anti-sigma factor